MIKSLYTLLFLAGVPIVVSAQSEYLSHPIDIKHYSVTIEVSNENDKIQCSETIDLKLERACDSFFIDLQSYGPSGKGMEISGPIKQGTESVEFNHTGNRIWIKPKSSWVGKDIQLSFGYEGVPETGLIMGKKKFEERTYFGDNWPNRAHHWFACVDHPSDKATVSFTVISPAEYGCIATGTLKEETKLPSGKLQFVYKTEIELPTKVMVVGLADFKVKELKSKLDFPITAWAYKQDAKNGFKDMKVAVDVVNYFIETIGTYPYEKLANVQSTTQYGGMENAGNIFYDENAVKGDQSMEALIAHEIAHQWFGNSASEQDWPHIWLSEGFATYFTDLYWEHTYGTEAMNERLNGERNRVLSFGKRYDHPVVDVTYEKLTDLLNPHSYQKGAWVLHMLRNKVGDEAFFKGIRNYYDNYQFSNATTYQFKKEMEAASGEDLTQFFEQWLLQSGNPKLLFIQGELSEKDVLIIRQEGKLFHFDIEVLLTYDDGTSETITINVDEEEESYVSQHNRRIISAVYDPNTKLLFEELGLR